MTYPERQEQVDPVVIQTSVGKVGIHPFTRTAVRVKSGLRPGPDDRWSVNGVTYQGYAFLYKWTDGAWHIGEEFAPIAPGSDALVRTSPWDRRHALDATREPYDHARGYDGNRITTAGRRKLESALENAVTAWAASRPAKLLLVRAEAIHQSNELRLKQQEYDKKRAELDELGDNLRKVSRDFLYAESRLAEWLLHEEELVDIAKGES